MTMSKYFGKCFSPSFRALKFSTQMLQLFIIKICFTIKVNSICGADLDTRNLCHKFISQGSTFRILGLRVASPKSQAPSSRVLCIRVSCPRVPGVRVSESQAPGPKPQGPGSQVSGPDFRLCQPKRQGKNLNISRTKRAFKAKYKAFFIIFKGLSVACQNFLLSQF